MESTNATLQPRDRLIPNPKLRLRAQVAEVCRFRHMSLRTEDTYWQWIRRYVLYHGKRPRELVRALDLTKPAHPPRVGTLLPIGQTRSVAAIGDTAFIADYGGSMISVDISNPAKPQELGRAFLDKPASDVAVSQGHAYVASADGVMVYDVRQPDSPRFVAQWRMFLPTGEHALAVEPMGSFLLVAGETQGLHILELPGAGALRLEVLAGSQPNEVRLRVSGPAGATGRIERSPDLRGWQDWTGFELTAGVAEVTDEGGPGGAQRFYRAVGR